MSEHDRCPNLSDGIRIVSRLDNPKEWYRIYLDLLDLVRFVVIAWNLGLWWIFVWGDCLKICVNQINHFAISLCQSNQPFSDYCRLLASWKTQRKIILFGRVIVNFVVCVGVGQCRQWIIRNSTKNCWYWIKYLTAPIAKPQEHTFLLVLKRDLFLFGVREINLQSINLIL